MTVRTKVALTGLCILLGCLVIASTFFLTSPWLVWNVLPIDAPVRAVAALPRQSESLILPTHFFTPAQAALFPRSSVFGVSVSAAQETIVVLPRLVDQRSLQHDLITSGWRVERLGFILRATRASETTQNLPRVFEAVQSTLKHLTSSQWPVRPAVLVSVAPRRAIEEEINIVATRRGRELRALLFPGNEPFENHQPIPVVASANTDQIVLKLPGYLFSVLSEKMKRSWNNTLDDRLALAATQPDLVGELTKFPLVYVVLSGQDVAAGVSSNGQQFGQRIIELLQEEERRVRTEQRAFRLPDGTLGYEKVPGKPIPIFGSVDEVGCQQSTVLKLTVWLCFADDRTAISTRKELAQSLIAADTGQNPYRVTIGSQALAELKRDTDCSDPEQEQPWCLIKSLTLQGRADRLWLQVEMPAA